MKTLPSGYLCKRRLAAALIGILVSTSTGFIANRLNLTDHSILLGLSAGFYFIPIGAGYFDLENYVAAEYPFGILRDWAIISTLSFTTASAGRRLALRYGATEPWPELTAVGLIATSTGIGMHLLRSEHLSYQQYRDD